MSANNEAVRAAAARLAQVAQWIAEGKRVQWRNPPVCTTWVPFGTEVLTSFRLNSWCEYRLAPEPEVIDDEVTVGWNADTDRWETFDSSSATMLWNCTTVKMRRPHVGDIVDRSRPAQTDPPKREPREWTLTGRGGFFPVVSHGHVLDESETVVVREVKP